MKTIHIFISSPGDVVAERENARRCIEQLQRRYLGRLKLVSLLWEELPLQIDRGFQEGIDLVLSTVDGIDIAIFIIWSRLGSPTGKRLCKPDGSEYRSGTEREFELMLRAREESGGKRPAILAYVRRDEAAFKDRITGAKGLDEIEELVRQSKLAEQFIREEFQEAGSGANTRAYHTFSEPASFASRLRVHLIELLDPLVPTESLLEKQWNDTPFRGLEVFEVEHSAIYFGRDQAVCDVQLALREQARRGCAFVLVVGASGSGKSSLARAGVMAGLTHDNVDPESILWRKSIFEPGTHEKGPCGALAEALCLEGALPELLQGGRTACDLAEALANAPDLAVSTLLKPALCQAAQGQPGGGRLLLLVDPLEELFTMARITEEAQSQFIRALAALARSGVVWVLATLRSDFYFRCQALPLLMEIKKGAGQYDLLAPTPAEVLRTIQQPAWLAGLRFEHKTADGAEITLDQVIFNEVVGKSGALPLMEYLLEQLYEQRTPDNVLTFAAYEVLGGVEGALSRRAEGLFASLSPNVQVALPAVLHRLATVQDGEGPLVVRRRVPLAQVCDTPERTELVELFLRQRLLVADRDADQVAVVQVAHEALFRRWERAAVWMHKNLTDLQARRRLELAHARWVAEQTHPDLLLPPGKPLTEALVLERRLGELLAQPLRDFVHASSEAVQAQEKQQGLVRALAANSLNVEAEALSQVRSLSKQVEPLIAAGKSAIRECDTLAADTRLSLPEATELLRARSAALQALKRRFDEQVASRKHLHKTLASLRAELTCAAGEVTEITATHAGLRRDIEHAPTLRASCRRLVSRAAELLAVPMDREQGGPTVLQPSASFLMAAIRRWFPRWAGNRFAEALQRRGDRARLRGLFDHAAKQAERAYAEFEDALAAMPDFSSQSQLVRQTLSLLESRFSEVCKAFSEIERVHLSLELDIKCELEPALKAADETVTALAGAIGEALAGQVEARENFDRACDEFAAACLGRSRFEELHERHVLELAPLKTAGLHAYFPIPAASAGCRSSIPLVASQTVGSQHAEGIMDGYPALREVYEELLRATGQLNITADSLRAFGNNCAELRTMLAKAGQDGQELQDEVEPLSGEARNLRDATSAEQAELKRAVEFVGQTRTKMEDACQRILELTVALRERTADLVSHTKQILLLTSLFVKQPDASPVTVGETGPELMT